MTIQIVHLRLLENIVIFKRKKRCLHFSAIKVDMDYELKYRPSSHVPYDDIRYYAKSFNHNHAEVH